MTNSEKERSGTLLPDHGECFVCGTSNPNGIGLRWYLQEDMSIIGYVTLGLAQQGPPNHAHGGASAAMLDEAMGSSAWAGGHKAMTVSMTTNYRKAVPLGVPLEVFGRIDHVEGRKIFTKSSIVLPDGTVAVEGEGVFLDVHKRFENNTAFHRTKPSQETTQNQS